MNTYALTLTILVCAAVELVVLIGLYAFNDSWLAAAFYSISLFGPISIAIGPALYRYIVRASN